VKIAIIGPFAFAPKATVSARAFPIAQALVLRGHHVSLFLPPYDNLAHAGRSETRDGVQIHNLALRRIRPWTPLSAAWRLASQVRRFGPDLVHVFKPVGYAALAGMILVRTTRLPLVVDSDDWEGTGGWNSINPYPWHWRRFFDLQERWLPRHASAVTVASRTLQSQVWGLGVPPERVFYAPNCPRAGLLSARDRVSETDRARIRQQLSIGSAPMLIFVGHISLGDDLDLALVALQEVQKHVPDVKLVVVGTGDGLARLRSLADELSLQDRVHFAGWVEHQRVPAYLAAADVAVYPYRDTLVNRAKCSIKILEYMAMGKAIVTTRVGQNLEYLEHGRSGILAEPGDANAFARALIDLLADPARAARLGQNAAQRIRDHFTWTDRISTIEQAYYLALG
jgi:glycosyltransferase involved in cell wall biosynthesis